MKRWLIDKVLTWITLKNPAGWVVTRAEVDEDAFPVWGLCRIRYKGETLRLGVAVPKMSLGTDGKLACAGIRLFTDAIQRAIYKKFVGDGMKHADLEDYYESDTDSEHK